MNVPDISPDIETLARMAARLAGRDPDERVIIRLAGLTLFDDLAWRYLDFLLRAQAALAMLTAETLPGGFSE